MSEVACLPVAKAPNSRVNSDRRESAALSRGARRRSAAPPTGYAKRSAHRGTTVRERKLALVPQSGGV